MVLCSVKDAGTTLKFVFTFTISKVQENQILVCDDYVNIMCENVYTIKKNAEAPSDIIKKVGKGKGKVVPVI
jgi:hypothetical protein